MTAMLVSRDRGDGIHLTVDELIALKAKCKALFLPARQPARSALAGPHQSRFRGRGVDFLESRHYQPGDDIRNMDWRVTARTGKAHTKVFQEERERPIMVAIDANDSMYFGTRVRLKSVQAARLAASLGWIATQRGDRIGGVIFGAGLHLEMRPAGGRRGVMRVIQQLVREYQPRSEPKPPEPLSEALIRMRNLVRPGSLLVIVSDFFNLDSDAERHLSRLAQHNDVLGCQIIDPAELHLPKGRFPITDGHERNVLDLNHRQQARTFRVLAEEHQTDPRRLFLRHGCRWITLDTQQDPVEVLGNELRQMHGR